MLNKAILVILSISFILFCINCGDTNSPSKVTEEQTEDESGEDSNLDDDSNDDENTDDYTDNGTTQVATISVVPCFTHSPDWNDYVKAADTSVECDGSESGGYDACIHSGERRKSVLDGYTACTGISATDALGIFNWKCRIAGCKAEVYTDGFKDGKGLRDCIDFTAKTWKQNSITVKRNTDTIAISSSSQWWSNTIVDVSTLPVLYYYSDWQQARELNQSGAVYVVTSDPGTQLLIGITAANICPPPGNTFSDNDYPLDAVISNTVHKVAIVTKPGVTITTAKANPVKNYSTIASRSNFNWIEADIAQGDRGIFLSEGSFSHIHNSSINNCSGGGHGSLFLENSSNNLVTFSSTDNSGERGLYQTGGSYNTYSGLTIDTATGLAVYLFQSSNNSMEDFTINGGTGFQFTESSQNEVYDLKILKNNEPIYLKNAHNNTFKGVKSRGGVNLSNASSDNLFKYSRFQNGLYFDNAQNNVFDACVFDNFGWISFSTHAGNDRNLIANSLTANSGCPISMTSSNSEDNYFINITTVHSNQNEGNRAGNGLLMNYAAINVRRGYRFDSGTYTVVNFGMIGQTNSTDAYSIVSSHVYATGLFKIDGDHNTSGITFMDETISTGDWDPADIIIGKKSTDVLANGSDNNGAAAGPGSVAAIDWLSFDSYYSVWGYDTSPILGESNQGDWSNDTEPGRIWDFSLQSTDTVFRAVLDNPNDLSGAKTVSHTWVASDEASCNKIPGANWGPNVCSKSGYDNQTDCETASGDWTSDKCSTTFLRNATEIVGGTCTKEGYYRQSECESAGGIWIENGNDNGLCESGEDCIYTPNLGAYQGHGNLVSAGTYNGPDITSVTLWQYQHNGR